MYLGAKEGWIEGKHLRHQLPIDPPKQKVVVPHLGSDRQCSVLILLNINEIPDGATAVGKKVNVLICMVKRPTRHGDEPPCLIIKRSKTNLNGHTKARYLERFQTPYIQSHVS